MRELLHKYKPYLLTLLYIVFPFDLIPEAFLGPIGAIDDVLLVLVVAGFTVYKFVNRKETDSH